MDELRNAVKIVDFSYPKFYRKRGELLRDLNETDPSPSKRKEILEELKELEKSKPYIPKYTIRYIESQIQGIRKDFHISSSFCISHTGL